MSAIHAPMFSGGGDPHFNYVIFLWPATTATDLIEGIWEAGGDAVISGGWATTPTPISDYWRMTPAIAKSIPGDYTVEFEFDSNFTNGSYTGTHQALFTGNFGGNNYPFVSFNGNNGALTLDVQGKASVTNGTVTSGKHRIELTRIGTDTRLFYDGVKVAEIADSGGTWNITMMGLGYTGHVGYTIIPMSYDNFRFTNGVGRYSDTHTLPTVPFPNS